MVFLAGADIEIKLDRLDGTAQIWETYHVITEGRRITLAFRFEGPCEKFDATPKF